MYPDALHRLIFWRIVVWFPGAVHAARASIVLVVHGPDGEKEQADKRTCLLSGSLGCPQSQPSKQATGTLPEFMPTSEDPRKHYNSMKWYKALDQGANPKGRRFDPPRLSSIMRELCHNNLLAQSWCTLKAHHAPCFRDCRPGGQLERQQHPATNYVREAVATTCVIVKHALGQHFQVLPIHLHG